MSKITLDEPLSKNFITTPNAGSKSGRPEENLGGRLQLASCDLDIRGAGNLVDEKQLGQIRGVGIELYQQMLEAAVDAARSARRC